MKKLNHLRKINNTLVACLDTLESKEPKSEETKSSNNNNLNLSPPSSTITTNRTTTSHTVKNSSNSNSNNTPPQSAQQVARLLILNSLQRQKILDMDLRLIAKNLVPMWATTTWKDKSSILRQLLEWLQTPQSRPDLPMDARATLFIIKKKAHTVPSTKLRYTSTLRSLAEALGMDSTPVLNKFQKALSALSASSPIKHATPFTPEQLEFLISKSMESSVSLALSIYLACKTASRWADIESLTKEKIIFNHHQNHQLQENEVVILWGAGLKTSRFKPFKATGYTVVREVNHPQMMITLKAHLKSMKMGAKLCPKSTQQMYKWLKKFPETANLSCHSFKVTQLSRMAELAVEGKLDPRLIPLVGKHQDRQLNHFPDSTIRYITKKVALAKMLGTQNATMLL